MRRRRPTVNRAHGIDTGSRCYTQVGVSQGRICSWGILSVPSPVTTTLRLRPLLAQLLEPIGTARRDPSCLEVLESRLETSERACATEHDSELQDYAQWCKVCAQHATSAGRPRCTRPCGSSPRPAGPSPATACASHDLRACGQRAPDLVDHRRVARAEH